MADRSTTLILDALARAAIESPDAPLYKSKGDDGLFPATVAGRAAADRARADGLLAITRTEAGKQPREWCSLTDKGRDWLLRHADPRPLLEDLVRVLEARQTHVSDLAQTARQLQAGLDGLTTIVRELLPRLVPENAPSAEPATDDDGLLEALTTHMSVAGEDYPLPELYRRLRSAGAYASIGAFHDALRRLHDADRIYLHPWTGPLYEMPEPALALLVGHEIAYYASGRTTSPGRWISDAVAPPTVPPRFEPPPRTTEPPVFIGHEAPGDVACRRP